MVLPQEQDQKTTRCQLCIVEPESFGLLFQVENGSGDRYGHLGDDLSTGDSCHNAPKTHKTLLFNET